MSEPIQCTERLPTRAGEYRIKHNSGVNNGEGVIAYDLEFGWQIPAIIQSFYKVVAWYDEPTKDPS